VSFVTSLTLLLTSPGFWSLSSATELLFPLSLLSLWVVAVDFAFGSSCCSQFRTKIVHCWNLGVQCKLAIWYGAYGQLYYLSLVLFILN